jgi:hypothetical protein
MGKPLVDITTFNAVQSLFVQGTQDPWRRELAGRLADLVILTSLGIRFRSPMMAGGDLIGSRSHRFSLNSLEGIHPVFAPRNTRPRNHFF